MHRLLLACCIVAATGCKTGSSLVVVTVDASPPLASVQVLHVTATANGRSMQYDIQSGGAPFGLPPVKTFAFEVSSLATGTDFNVQVEARDASAAVLGTGGGAARLAQGARRDIAITLTGGTSDGGVDDGAVETEPDLFGVDFFGCVPATDCNALGVTCGSTSDGCGGQLVCPPCQLNAIHQPLGIAGNNIWLEGKFQGTSTVSFPGGATATATLLGPNRASVTVPNQATSGSLTVTTGGMTTAPLPFRRPAFAMGLASFLPEYEQAEYARSMPVLKTAREGHTAVVAGNWLFVLGGYNIGYLGSVERAMINADGTLGAFSPGGTLATPSYGHTSVVLGKWVYVIGGNNGSEIARVERAPILASGLLGAFADAGVALTVPRYGATATIVGDSLYIIGGGNGSTYLTSVERARIAGDGTLGAFADAGVVLKTGRSLHTAAVVGNSLYVVGGTSGASTYTDKVESAPISGNGDLGAFAEDATAKLVTARSGHQMQVVGDKLYVFGGYNGSGVTTVESATINGSTLNAFGTVGGVTSSVHVGFASAVVGNYVYAIGGNGANVDRASINASGAIDTFTTSTVTLAAPDEPWTPTVIGNYVYSIRGNKSQRGVINPDGTLGSFTLLNGITASGPTVVSGNWVYLINTTQAQRAAINDDGTLGSFENVTVTKTASGFFRLAFAGSWLYSVGGTSGTDSSAYVERSTVAADGALGNFSNSGVPQASARRTRGNSAVLGTSLFVFAGYDSETGGLPSATERASLDGATRAVTAWSAAGTNANNYDPASAVVGPKLYQMAGAYGSNAVYVGSVSDSALTFTTASGVTTQTNPRQIAGSLVTNSHVYLLGGLVQGPPVADADTIEQAPLK